MVGAWSGGGVAWSGRGVCFYRFSFFVFFRSFVVAGFLIIRIGLKFITLRACSIFVVWSLARVAGCMYSVFGGRR